MHIFISDAHIRTESSYRARMLMKFLRSMRARMQGLYILGDLFEFWFEYNVVFPRDYFKTLAVLYNLIQDGVQVHYILGNHEVMIGRFLNEFGFKVHNQNATLTIEGKRVFLAHGHMIDRRLWTTIWQKLLTSKVNHALYSLIHPDVGVFLAQGIAFLSRKQRRSPNAAALLERYARSKFEYADIVMLAHSHIPVLKKFPGNKYYINTGDWIEHFTYGVIDKSGISLRRFKTPLQ